MHGMGPHLHSLGLGLRRRWCSLSRAGHGICICGGFRLGRQGLGSLCQAQQTGVGRASHECIEACLVCKLSACCATVACEALCVPHYRQPEPACTLCLTSYEFIYWGLHVVTC